MKRLLSLLMLSLLTAGIAFSQATAPRKQESLSKGRHTPLTINFSLWKDIATQQTDTVGNTRFNLGIFSAINRLNGMGINLLGATTKREVNGVQVTGVSNLTGGGMRGVQVAGITNINGEGLRGVSVSGLVGICNNDARGVVLSGLATINGDHSRALTLGGLLNIHGTDAAGMHLAGLADISNEDFTGFSCSGLLNVIGNHLTGIQISGIGNIVGGTARGVQIGAANMAMRAKGLQIGLFNYYKESLDGFQLGLVNANPHTKVQLLLYGGNTTKLNIGVRFKNRLFYTILGGGTHYLDFGNKFSAALSYRAGLELPLYKQLFLSGDLGYQHIETFKNKEHGIPARLYALQARINLEFHLTERFGIFCTGGYGGSRYYNKGVTYDKGAIVEGGIVLLKR